MSLRTSVDDPTVPCYVVDIAGCGNGTEICADTPIEGSWRHLAGTYDGDTMRLFVNGLLDRELAGVPFDASSWMTAGATTFFNGNQAFYTGVIDEIRLWSVVRSEEEIRSTIHAGLVGDEPGLLGYWTLDEGSGQQVGDSSGSGFAGVLGETDAAESSDPSWVESQALRVPALSVVGECPGTVTIGLSGASSSGRLVLLKSPTTGGARILPRGPCAGSVLGLEAPSLFAAIVADADGSLSIDRAVPAGACGIYLQLVDGTNCAVSNVGQIPLEATPGE